MYKVQYDELISVFQKNVDSFCDKYNKQYSIKIKDIYGETYNSLCGGKYHSNKEYCIDYELQTDEKVDNEKLCFAFNSIDDARENFLFYVAKEYFSEKNVDKNFSIYIPSYKSSINVIINIKNIIMDMYYNIVNIYSDIENCDTNLDNAKSKINNNLKIIDKLYEILELYKTV